MSRAYNAVVSHFFFFSYFASFFFLRVATLVIDAMYVVLYAFFFIHIYVNISDSPH